VFPSNERAVELLTPLVGCAITKFINVKSIPIRLAGKKVKPGERPKTK